MTKKDFLLISASIAQELSHYKDLTPEASAIRGVARRMATQLENANPAFNRARFLTACGVN
jgi:hypothetical protein